MSQLRDAWQRSLHQALERSQRVALLGIGHELRGDDAAGVAVAAAVQSRMMSDRALLVLNGGSAPENQTGALRRFKPDLVLLIDAAQLDESPGAIRWLAWQDTIGLSASTHSLPIHLLAQYLTGELGCEVALIGIQPEHTSIGAPLSDAVRRSIDNIVQSLSVDLCFS